MANGHWFGVATITSAAYAMGGIKPPANLFTLFDDGSKPKGDDDRITIDVKELKGMFVR